MIPKESQYPSTVPGLGSADGECITGRVVYGPGLHAAGIAAVIWFCQAKAAQDFSSSCAGKKEEKESHKSQSSEHF